MLIDKDLLKKYNVPTPRYTSYPPANFFTGKFQYFEAVKNIDDSNNQQPENISFYLHIPFCSQLCSYCGCNTHITHDKQLIQNYVDVLKQEILLYKSHLSPNRKISQIHWGGGTPDYLNIDQIKELMQLFFDNFDFTDNPEIAMECHPAHLSYEYMNELVNMRFSRLSVGVQDFEVDVLDAVNRELPNLPINDIVKYLQSKNVPVNLDFVYGLPLQTIESFSKTIDKAIDISPDRIALFSYAHVPWVKPHQKILEKYLLPKARLKTEIFEMAFSKFTTNSYVSIGLDHFAKPNDELAIALKNKNLSRNFQGYCTRQTTGQVYALGVSGISQLNNAFLQNTKDIKTYSQKISEGIFPFEKVYFLNKNEKIISHIITEIMTNRYVSSKQIESIFNINFHEIMSATKLDLSRLQQFKDEGLIEISDFEITVTHKGLFFLRNIAAAFDPLMQQPGKKFSKAL
jgi:oxygen-independent coproporphyrinogen-3 oxidase